MPGRMSSYLLKSWLNCGKLNLVAGCPEEASSFGDDASNYFLFLALAFAGDFFFADFGGFFLAAAFLGFEVIFLVAAFALFCAEATAFFARSPASFTASAAGSSMVFALFT